MMFSQQTRGEHRRLDSQRLHLGAVGPVIDLLKRSLGKRFKLFFGAVLFCFYLN